MIIALLVGAVYAGFPVVWMLSSSFKSNTEIFAYPPRLIGETSSWGAYLAVLTSSEKVRFFINSYLVSGLVTICTLIVGTLAGYSFSRYQFKFKKPLNMIIIGVQAVPPITLLIPYFGLIVALQLFNTYAALVLTYMVFTLPYAIIMMTGYFNTLPRELDEAVMIDGGSSAGCAMESACTDFLAWHCCRRYLHIYAGLERIPVCAHLDEDDGHAHRPRRDCIADGSACLRME